MVEQGGQTKEEKKGMGKGGAKMCQSVTVGHFTPRRHQQKFDHSHYYCRSWREGGGAERVIHNSQLIME